MHPDKYVPGYTSQSVEFIGRPDRDTIIGSDEIINLRIALETTNDVLDFLKVIK